MNCSPSCLSSITAFLHWCLVTCTHRPLSWLYLHRLLSLAPRIVLAHDQGTGYSMGLVWMSGVGWVLGPLLRWSLCPCRNYSAVCVYSLGDIDKVFRTSSLKGYHMGLPTPRPGKVSSDTSCDPGPSPLLSPLPAI